MKRIAVFAGVVCLVSVLVLGWIVFCTDKSAKLLVWIDSSLCPSGDCEYLGGVEEPQLASEEDAVCKDCIPEFRESVDSHKRDISDLLNSFKNPLDGKIREHRQLKNYLNKLYDNGAQLIASSVLDVQDSLISNYPEDTVLIFYDHKGDTLLEYAFSSESVIMEEVAISEKELKEMFDEFREALGVQRPQGTRVPRKRGRVVPFTSKNTKGKDLPEINAKVREVLFPWALVQESTFGT